MKTFSLPRIVRCLAQLGLLSCSPFIFGQTADSVTTTNLAPLTRLSLTDLAVVEVTSASRTEEALMNAPAAVAVISNEDVRRSGATSIAEALRMAPGLHVANINANKWAISSRGFNNRYANKQLVMIDGRTVYTPIYSGVYWDAQDMILEDLERIEVVRGPGGALWGANAVNGVINILTKPAYDTQGLLLFGGGGTELHQFGGFRYGGALATNLHYRVYAKAMNHSDSRDLTGGEAADEWWQQREGMRVDWRPTEADLITLQAETYYIRAGDRLTLAAPTPPYRYAAFERAKGTGANVLSRWTHTFAEESDLTLQAYYDRNDRESLSLGATIDTYDFDAQHRMQLGERNELIWGLGYRLMSDEIESTYTAFYDPATKNDQLFSGFIQDKIEVVEDRVFLTLGAKLEHNDYTDWEFQPSARVLLKPTDDQTIWAAVSRAVRTPARFEGTVLARVPLATTPNGIVVNALGPQLDSEKLIAYETGYRVQPTDYLFFDLALFYNDYEDLRSIERGPTSLGPPLIASGLRDYQLEGESYGLEFAPSWQVTEEWRLSAGYSLLKMNLHPRAGSTDTTSERAEGDSPQQQFHIRSFLNLPYNLQFDTAVYYVDDVPNQRLIGAQTVNQYTRVDFRLGWTPKPNLDFSLAFQNALDPRHAEFGSTSPLVTPTEVQRSVYAKVTWRF